MALRAAIIIAVTGTLALASVSGARAEGLEEPGCKPYWSKQCAARTAGVTTVEGTVTSTNGLPLSAIRLGYRTVEGSQGPGSGELEYGPWGYASVNSRGEFKVSLPACSPTVRAFGCVGGEYEVSATYEEHACSEDIFLNLFVGEASNAGTFACNAKPKPKSTTAKHHKKRRRKKHK